MKNKYHKILSLIFISLLILTGCATKDSLDDYKVKMDKFFEKMSDYDNAINSLDPDSDSSVADLLSYLDGIALAVSEMSHYHVPENFYGVTELAIQADEYMTEAVMLFRQAYQAYEYDENIAYAAKENYERANLRLRYIADILRGDIPEEIFQ